MDTSVSCFIKIVTEVQPDDFPHASLASVCKDLQESCNHQWYRLARDIFTSFKTGKIIISTPALKKLAEEKIEQLDEDSAVASVVQELFQQQREMLQHFPQAESLLQQYSLLGKNISEFLQIYMETDLAIRVINKRIIYTDIAETQQIAFDDTSFDAYSFAEQQRRLDAWFQENKSNFHISKSELDILYLEEKNLNYIPPEIGELTQVLEIRLNKNRLCDLPPEISNCSSVQNLWLQNNRLCSLPTEMSKMTQLTLLNIENNQLPYLPERFALPRLTDLYLEDNPWVRLDIDRIGFPCTREYVQACVLKIQTQIEKKNKAAEKDPS